MALEDWADWFEEKWEEGPQRWLRQVEVQREREAEQSLRRTQQTINAQQRADSQAGGPSLLRRVTPEGESGDQETTRLLQQIHDRLQEMNTAQEETQQTLAEIAQKLPQAAYGP